MSRQVVFHPVAEKEFAEVEAFYWSCDRVGLVASFLDDVERVLNHVAERPSAGRQIAEGIRTWKLRRFPYTIIYRTFDETVRVLAFAHHRRRPGYWKRRR